MRSKILKQILEETPKEVDIFVRMYGDIIVRVHQILMEKRITQKDLAERLGKTPSEVSKWLGGNHNFTLRSLAKLQAELDEIILYVPKRDSFHVQRGGQVKANVERSKPISRDVRFENWIAKTELLENQPKKEIAA